MSLTKVNVNTELRKWLKGKETKVPVDAFLQEAVRFYLEAGKTAKAEAGEPKDIAWLERMFRLEDPRS